MAGRVVHAHVGKSPHGSEEAGRLGGKVYSTQFHSDHEKDTNGSNGNSHQYNGELSYPRHSHQHGYQHGHQQHGHHQFQHYDEELHPHGCLCTSCTCTSEAYCPPIIDLPKEYETKVKIVQRYPEMRTVEKTFWVKEVQREDRVFMVPKTEIVGYETIPRCEIVPYLKEVTKMRIEIRYEVVKKEIEYTVMVPCIEYEKKIIIDKIPRVHKEIYEEIRDVPILETEQVTKCTTEWTGKYIEEPIPVEEYCTPGEFNILCKDGRHHGDHHQFKRRSSRASSVASVEEDRHHHHHRVVETNGVPHVDSIPKEAHTPTKTPTKANGAPHVESLPKEAHTPTKTPTKAEDPAGVQVPYPPIKVPAEEAKEPPKHPVTVQHPIPNHPIPAPGMPIKEHEGPRNRSGNMRQDIDDDLPAIHNPFNSLVHDGPSPPHAKVTVTKTTTQDHEAAEHAKPVVLPTPATTKTNKDQQPSKIIAGTPPAIISSKSKDHQHPEDHQHVTLATAGAIKPTDQHQHEEHVKLATAGAIKPTDHQQHEDHQIATKTATTQAAKPKEKEKEKVAAPPAIPTQGAGKKPGLLSSFIKN